MTILNLECQTSQPSLQKAVQRSMTSSQDGSCVRNNPPRLMPCFFVAADFCGAGASLQTASNYKSESSLATKTERTEITEVTEISTSEEMDCWEPQTGRMLQH